MLFIILRSNVQNTSLCKDTFNSKKKTHLDKCTEKKNLNSGQEQKVFGSLGPTTSLNVRMREKANSKTSYSASAQLPLEPEPVKTAVDFFNQGDHKFHISQASNGIKTFLHSMSLITYIVQNKL